MYEDDEEPRLFSPLLVFLAVILAAGLGLGIGLLLTRDSEREPLTEAGLSVALPSPEPPEPEVLISPPVVNAPAPVTSVFVIAPPPPPPPPPPPSPTPSPSPSPDPNRLSLTIDPASGGNGAELLVSGTGWPASSTVRLDYLGIDGKETGSKGIVAVKPDGTFMTRLVAEDPTDRPGRHTVRATDGTRTLEVGYEVVP